MATAAISHPVDGAQGRGLPFLKRHVFKTLDSRIVFLLGLLLAGSGLVSPPVALLGGIAFGFAVVHPLRREASALSRLLLQASVVALGFGMNVQQVAHAGRSGFLYTAISISVAMGLGLLLGKLLKIAGKASFLITAGTAICGGSAIAAVAPITQANEEEISVSMGTVFLLNSLALLLFPVIGHLLKLDQNQFGLWAALAIHDTSSVVGAASAYGAQALQIGTTVKLARALWIVPVSLLTAAFMARLAATAKVDRNHANTGVTDGKAKVTEGKAKVTMPWFILYFCAAAAASTYLPRFHETFATLNHLGKAGLTATLFLIGTGLSRQTLKQVGFRPLVQGVALWIVLGVASLAAIYFHIIAI
jgi:uncharacterized integral membrane protein (TIGR00698 family)